MNVSAAVGVQRVSLKRQAERRLPLQDNKFTACFQTKYTSTNPRRLADFVLFIFVQNLKSD
jgi:hypothetical protein